MRDERANRELQTPSSRANKLSTYTFLSRGPLPTGRSSLHQVLYCSKRDPRVASASFPSAFFPALCAL